MFERYTEAAKEIVRLCHEDGMRLHIPYVSEDQVLLALLRIDWTAGLLNEAGLDYNTVEAAVVARRGAPVHLPESTGLPFTTDCNKVFELALREALSLGQNYIEPEHVLLAYLRLKGSGVATAWGLDQKRLHDRTCAALLQRLRQDRDESGEQPADPRYDSYEEKAADEQEQVIREVTDVLNAVNEEVKRIREDAKDLTQQTVLELQAIAALLQSGRVIAAHAAVTDLLNLLRGCEEGCSAHECKDSCQKVENW